MHISIRLSVNQARNLPSKGKNGGRKNTRVTADRSIYLVSLGIDAFCTISMGKDKFVTAVREKTTSPDWFEQCDM